MYLRFTLTVSVGSAEVVIGIDDFCFDVLIRLCGTQTEGHLLSTFLE
jgi:hypothetical protein